MTQTSLGKAQGVVEDSVLVMMLAHIAWIVMSAGNTIWTVGPVFKMDVSIAPRMDYVRRNQFYKPTFWTPLT
jgi:hypothetical protein